MLDLQQILILADELVFAKTGKHLDNLQQSILRGILENKKYPDIANENSYSEGYIRDVASQLWQMLSEELGESINKFNFKSTIERLYNYSNSTIIGDPHQSINICEYPRQHLDISDNNNHKINPKKLRKSLKNISIPRITNFYGRDEELHFLKGAVNNQCRLLTIFGERGMGKTYLAAKLVELIGQEFDYIFWYNLEFLTTFEELQQDIIRRFEGDKNKKYNPDKKKGDILRLIKDCLAENRCLIVIDNWQDILSKGKLAASYQEGYEEYALLIKSVAENHHQSCLILLTQELTREIEQLSEFNPNCSLLHLRGLGESSYNILKHKQISDKNSYDRLIEIYRENPLYLEIVATIVNKYFGGDTQLFLQNEQPFLEDNLTSILEEKIERLTGLERRGLEMLAEEVSPTNWIFLQTKMEILASELIKILESLERRNCVEIVRNNGEIGLIIDPILREYLRKSNE
jgi:hypothetical protein